MRNLLLHVAWIVAVLTSVMSASAQRPCDAVPTFDDGIAPTREIHVAPPPAGSNQSGDGSEKRPYATIGFAVARATPGTAVRIHTGTYSGGTFLQNVQGTAAAPIWIGGAAKEHRPVIEGGTEGLHLSRCSYVVVHDLEIRGVSANGVNSDDGGDVANPLAAHHQVFRSLHIHDIGSNGNQDGLKLSGLYDFVVVDCELARCGGGMSGSGIDMVGCHDGVIARCFMHDLSANAVQAKGGTSDVEIRWCRMVNAGERAINIGGSTGFEFFRPPLVKDGENAEARRVRAVANVIVGANAAVAFVGAVDCVFAQNTVIDPRVWIFRILQETTSKPPYLFTPCSNNTFANNLVYFDRTVLRTHLNIGGSTSPMTFTFSHNMWFAHDNPAASGPNLPVAETGGVVGVDPRLIDPKGGDYSICATGPAAGVGMSPAWAAGDFRGACFRKEPPIGAYDGPESPAADFDGDGRATSQDFFDFLAVLFLVDPAADFNGDGSVNSQDSFDFVQAFFGGC